LDYNLLFRCSRASASMTWWPEFATTVVATGAGHEKRNVNWSEARGRWDVASGLKKQAQIDELIAFFRARQGKAYGFRFKDWTDYKATGQLLGTGDDVLTQFQLVKHYPSGSVIKVRTITKPVAGTVKVYLDGIEQLSGWSVDMTTGLVTFGAAPALGVEVTADFDNARYLLADHAPRRRGAGLHGPCPRSRGRRVTYRAASGYTRTAISGTADLAVDNLDVESVFSDEGITEEDLRTGTYDTRSGCSSSSAGHPEAAARLARRGHDSRGHVRRRGLHARVLRQPGRCPLRRRSHGLRRERDSLGGQQRYDLSGGQPGRRGRLCLGLWR
jgi:uncharacterized protein (TIGR02217 family)